MHQSGEGPSASQCGQPDTGSLTHCVGYRAAAVARVVDVPLLGIDGEPNSPLPEDVVKSVALPSEQELLLRLADLHSEVHWDRLLFSAKESVYKAWFPLTRRWLGFKDVRLTIDAESRAFTATLLVDGAKIDGGTPLDILQGLFCLHNGLIATTSFQLT